MSAWCRSGAAVRLLAVLCLTAGCAATQQQPSAVSSTTADEVLDLIARAVRAELRPIVSKMESRMDALDDRLRSAVSNMVLLGSRVDALDSRLEPRVDALDSRLVQLGSRVNRQIGELSSRLDGQQYQLVLLVAKVDGRISPQLGEVISKTDIQQSHLDEFNVKSNNQTSKLDSIATKLDDQISHLENLQTQIAEQTVRLDRVEEITPRPRDCSDLPGWPTSGVHVLWPGPNHSVPAYCDMDTDGGRWTVFQRRQDIRPRQDFYLGWESYKKGFGNLTGEFWWGLQYLSMLTSVHDRQYELRIDLEDIDSNKRYAVYQGFRISSETDGYRLTFTANSYTGDAGDSLYNNSRFSTRDRGQDVWSTVSCAELYKGAWWYRDCGYSSLNGRYLEDGDDDWTGIWWYKWKRSYESLKSTDMKIRPT